MRMEMSRQAVGVHWSKYHAPSDRRGSSESRGSDRPLRVLIVEDEVILAMELEGMLLGLGYDVVGVAASGPEAVSTAAEQHPDVVLMDIRLAGGTDGVEAAIKIRERWDIPSIFTTAYTDSGTQERAASARPVGWVKKPYSSARIVAALKSAAGQA